MRLLNYRVGVFIITLKTNKMMLPTEFVESFESQYPKPQLKYTLPESLDRCPRLKNQIITNIGLYHKIILTHMDDAGVIYNILTRTYKTITAASSQSMSDNGYNIIFNKICQEYSENISPKAFSFILQDLEDIDNVKFNAELTLQTSQYFITKSIDLQKAWIEFCLKHTSEFAMNFEEYSEFIKTMA